MFIFAVDSFVWAAHCDSAHQSFYLGTGRSPNMNMGAVFLVTNNLHCQTLLSYAEREASPCIYPEGDFDTNTRTGTSEAHHFGIPALRVQ